MAKHFQRLITGLCLLAGLGTSGPVGAADGISQDPAYYERKRAQIRQACEEFEAQGTEPYQKIYDMLPDRSEEYSIIFWGSKSTEFKLGNGIAVVDWKWLKTDEHGMRCSEVVDETLEIISPEYIFRRIKRLIISNKFDLKLVNPVSDATSMPDWPSYHHLFDKYLQPVPPGARISYPDDQVRRRAQFSLLIEQEDDLVIKKFILFTSYYNDGNRTLEGFDWVEDLRRGWGIRFASKALIAESPKWYKAYNDLVPMLCNRLTNWAPHDQKACLTRGAKRR